MSQIQLVFTAGLLGVFLSMAVLYGSMRFTAWAVDRLTDPKETRKEESP